MRVTVDLDALRVRTQEAVESLRSAQPLMTKQILDSAAEEERATHDYQNRTGDAEASTQAGTLQQGGDGFSVTFGMDVDYAIYLDRRGLTQVVQKAEEADTEIAYYFEGERDRLAGL